ncbi:MAG TPA: PQQ-binding-like beta-propeller repeat protein [Steroidobacteraceae bacterium]
MRAATTGFFFPLLVASLLASVAPAADKPAGPDEADPRNWTSPGRVATGSHFSPLTEINRETVSRLRLAWTLDLDVTGANSTPLAVDGVVYVAAGYSLVFAVDGKTGKQLWRYDPGVVSIAGRKLRSGAGIRGLAYSKGRLFVGTHDGRLLALDAKKGTLVWGVEVLSKDDFTFISGAPRVFNDRVVIGFGDSHAEFGAIEVYSAIDGQFLWRWQTDGGGGAIWNAITVDEANNRFYIGTGNARGDTANRFACSVVAVMAPSGKQLWQYDEAPDDDRARRNCDSSMDLTLATIEVSGAPRRVLLHAPRDGRLHVIDADTGAALSAQKLGMGAHSHFAQSFSPRTGWLYLPATELPATLDPDSPADAAKSHLLAWDPATQRAQWAIPTPGAYGGGVLSTAGDLVFQGQADGYLVAYGASDGRKAWAYFAAIPPLAAPISYGIGSRQYIAVLAGPPNGQAASLGAISGQFGWDSRQHPRRLMAFTLDGTAELPATPGPNVAKPADVPEFTLDPALVEEGSRLYARCQWCHGIGAIAGGGAPDLRASAVPMNPAAFAAAVRGGNEARGMPKFAELTDRDLTALRHYFRARARAAASPATP